MGFWDENGYDDSWGAPPQTAGNAGTYRRGGGGGRGPVTPPQTNPAGSDYDPFAYTKGTLLAPWEGHFDGSKYGSGGGSAPEYTPFQFDDFNYNAPNPGTFGEVYNDPGDFTYGEYTSRGPYKGPNERDLRSDPSYKYRQEQGQRALLASKAAQGVLRTGGTGKALVRFGQEEASKEFANVDARKRRDYEGDVAEDRFRYGTNRGNATENFDRNVNNKRLGYQTRQAAWKDNAGVTLEAGRLGYDVAQGTYDRNLSLHRQQYEDEQAHRNAIASAAASGNREAYERALDEYKMARDEFYTNQDRQYRILDNEDMKGRDAAYRYAGFTSENTLGRGNAAASGRVGSANAWTNAMGNIGDAAMDVGLYASSKRRPTSTVGAR